MKIACFNQKMNDFWAKKGFYCPFVTLLPSLLPPLNLLNISLLIPKVAVVAVKIKKIIVYEVFKEVYP